MDHRNREWDFSIQLFVAGGEGEEEEEIGNMFIHITYDPQILSGKPHIRGTRLSVEFILELFASGATRNDIMKAYPQLTFEAIEHALRYAAKSMRNEVLL